MVGKVDSQQIPTVRGKDIISEEISGEYVVYDKLRNRAHHLNQTLSWIWQRCDGTNDIGRLASTFEHQFGVSNGTTIIVDALAQLQANGLLENSVVPEAGDVQRVSRRAVVAAGSVALPAIVSIVAPTPAAARSDKDKDKKDKK